MNLKMSQKSQHIVVGFLSICVSFFLPAGVVYGQANTPENTFSDWKITCPENDRCRMAQTIILKKSQTPLLQMRIFKEDKGQSTALFTFPLGILLSTGWRYQIDNSKEQLRPFEICNTDGCHAGIPLNQELIGRLKRGGKLHVTFFDSNKKVIKPTLSLTGFTKAYNALVQ